MHEACQSSSAEICDILLHKGANPNAETTEGVTPLHYLVSRKFEDFEQQQELLVEMLAKGVDVNHAKNSNTEAPLHYSVTRGLVDCTRWLLNNGADINVKNK